ncbi:MAG TPA: DUF3575 domain-containing protein [Gemmatimonadaceae bacterium]|nr:DUF3575 domain-containing protein [Gemmatimonadaceae bacterium]
MRTLRTIALAAALAIPAMVSAQAPAAKSNVLSIQPLAAMFTVYAGELEHRLGTASTIGLGASYWSHGDTNKDGSSGKYASGDLKLKYYPQGHALEGFSVGGQVGYTSLTGTETTINGSTTTTQKETLSGPTVGISLDYNWLLGATKGFYIGLGAGAKKLFIKDSAILTDVIATYPTARLSIGFAF